MPLVIAGDILIAAGFAVVFRVFRENTFTSARIEIAKEQRVITPAPMRWSAIRCMPALSCTSSECRWHSAPFGGFVAIVPIVGVIIWRLLDEEVLLASGLPGYADYLRSVRWRLIPGIF